MAGNRHEPAGDGKQANVSVQTGRKIVAAAVVLLLVIALVTVAGNAVRRAWYEAVDPFAALQIEAHGESPDISLEVSWEPDTPFLQSVEYTVSEHLSELKNGDTVIFRASVDQSVCDEYKMKLSDTKYTYTVDVPDYEEVDPFASLEVKTEGASPDISLTYAQMDDSPFLACVRISVDRDYDLATGDTVTFTAEVDSSACDEYRMKLSRDSMTYTVSSDEYYITPSAQPSDSVRASLADFASRSMAGLLGDSNGAEFDVNNALTNRYAGNYVIVDWYTDQYTIKPLCVLVTEPSIGIESRIFIALEVSGVYRTNDNIETDPACPISDTSIWAIEYRDAKANATEVLSFKDCGASYTLYDTLDDVRFEVRREYGAISEIDLSDMSETTSS